MLNKSSFNSKNLLSKYFILSIYHCRFNTISFHIDGCNWLLSNTCLFLSLNISQNVFSGNLIRISDDFIL